MNAVEFAGPTFDRDDSERLRTQFQAVRRLMLRHRGIFVTLAEISREVGCSECSASARLRDLRKAGFTVERRLLTRRGLHGYRIPMPRQLPMEFQ